MSTVERSAPTTDYVMKRPESASTRGRVAALLAIVGVATFGCALGSSPPPGNPTQTAVGCSVSNLELGPDGFAPYGLARAGPLWFSAFGRVQPGSPAILAAEGGPGGPYDGWKVVIHPDPNHTGSAKLSGVQCSTGKAVRFCYATCGWDSRLKTSVVTQTVDVDQHLDYTGYMVFPGPGLMRLTTRDSRDVVSMVVIEVPRIGAAQAPDLLTYVGSIGTPGCEPAASFRDSEVGFPEAGVDSTRGSLWALVFNKVPPPAGKDIKIVWRMTGSGSFAFRVADLTGESVPLAGGPDPHGGSNWNHPGDEVGAGINFPHPGCWDIQVSRSNVSGDLWLEVGAS